MDQRPRFARPWSELGKPPPCTLLTWGSRRWMRSDPTSWVVGSGLNLSHHALPGSLRLPKHLHESQVSETVEHVPPSWMSPCHRLRATPREPGLETNLSPHLGSQGYWWQLVSRLWKDHGPGAQT